MAFTKSQIKQIQDEKLREAIKSKYLEDETAKKEANEKLETLLKDNESYKSKIEDLDKRIIKAKEEGKKELAKELEGLKTKYQDLEKSNETLKTELNNSKLDNALNNAIDKLGVTNKEIAKLTLKGFAKLDDNGNIIFDDGVKRLELEEGAKGFFETKAPELLKPVGNDGVNPPNFQNGDFGGLKRSEMTDEQKIDFIEKNGQEKYFSLKE